MEQNNKVRHFISKQYKIEAKNVDYSKIEEVEFA